MNGNYHVVELDSKGADKTIEMFCKTNGQLLLPLVDLITDARLAVDQVIDRAGRGLIQTIFLLSAEQVAGPKTPGKTKSEICWQGVQAGRVSTRHYGEVIPEMAESAGVSKSAVSR